MRAISKGDEFAVIITTLLQFCVMINQFRKKALYFFRNEWWHFRQHRLSNYLFLSPKMILIFALFFILNIFFFWNKVGFTIKFLSLDNALLTMQVVVRSIVILLGIIISFTLLSFQVFNKYFGRFAFLDFFKKGHLKQIFTLFILNVVFSIYVQSYLKDCKTDENFDSYGKLIFVESLVLSLILILGIFPIMIKLLSESQSRSNIQILFENISKHDIYFSTAFYKDDIEKEEYETNSFKVILEIGLVSIKEFDHVTFNLLVRNIFLKFKRVMAGDDDADLKRSLFYKFKKILGDYFDFAAKEKNSSALQEIVICRYYIEIEISQRDPPIILDHSSRYYGWDFSLDMEKFYDKSNQYNEDNISSVIVDCCRDYMVEIIKRRLPKNFVYDYNAPYREIYYTGIISHYYSLIRNFHIIAGNLKKITILKSLSNLYMTLDLSILGSENHKDTKTYLLQVNNQNKLEYLESLVGRAGVKDMDSLLYPFGVGLTNEITDLNTSIIFRSSMKAWDYIFQRGTLNNSIINSLKADTMSFISHYRNEPIRSKNLISLSLDKFDYIRELIGETASDEGKDIYLKLARFLSYIKSDYEASGINDTDLNAKFAEVSVKFTFKAKFEEELGKKGYLQKNGLF